MLQRWDDLAFLHQRIDPEEIQSTLPDGLKVDTYRDESGAESAYIGLVPFRMRGIRLPGRPAIPYLSAFPETNVRTYVVHPERGPGVWFYSLDAARRAACIYARRFFHLPYRWTRMSVEAEGLARRYQSVRLEPPKPCVLSLDVELEGKPAATEPGSLPFFFVERYQLFVEHRGRIFSGIVHHTPYEIQPAQVRSYESQELTVLGFHDAGKWDSILFSPGVDVEIFSLK